MLKVSVPKGISKPVSWGANEMGRKPGSMLVQECYLHTIEEDGTPSFAPVRFEIILNRAKVDPSTGQILTPAQEPFAAGEYQLHPSSVYLDRLGKIAINPRLTPMQKRAA